ALAQPPANLVLLARALDEANERVAAVQLLRRAQQRHPGDFWINYDLANLLLLKDQPTNADPVGYFRAALALRPQNPAIQHNLGTALWKQGMLAEAEEAFRRAIEI